MAYLLQGAPFIGLRQRDQNNPPGNRSQLFIFAGRGTLFGPYQVLQAAGEAGNYRSNQANKGPWRVGHKCHPAFNHDTY